MIGDIRARARARASEVRINWMIGMDIPVPLWRRSREWQVALNNVIWHRVSWTGRTLSMQPSLFPRSSRVICFRSAGDEIGRRVTCQYINSFPRYRGVIIKRQNKTRFRMLRIFSDMRFIVSWNFSHRIRKSSDCQRSLNDIIRGFLSSLYRHVEWHYTSPF